MNLPNGYSVTREGKVFSPTGEEIKQYIRKGYYYVSIKGKKYSVHRLVAFKYLDNALNKPEIDHIDGNPFNNNVTNLRWVTRSENEMNPITRKRISCANKGRKLDEDWRRKISQSLMGIKQSEETKIKRADKLRGIKRPQYIKDILLKSNIKPVTCLFNGEEIEFESQKEAAKYFGINTTLLSEYIRGIKKDKSGRIWIRKK